MSVFRFCGDRLKECLFTVQKQCSECFYFRLLFIGLYLFNIELKVLG